MKTKRNGICILMSTFVKKMIGSFQAVKMKSRNLYRGIRYEIRKSRKETD